MDEQEINRLANDTNLILAIMDTEDELNKTGIYSKIPIQTIRERKVFIKMLLKNGLTIVRTKDLKS